MGPRRRWTGQAHGILSRGALDQAIDRISGGDGPSRGPRISPVRQDRVWSAHAARANVDRDYAEDYNGQADFSFRPNRGDSGESRDFTAMDARPVAHGW